MTREKLLIGIDIGGTKISAGLIALSGKIIARDKAATPDSAKARDALRSIIETVKILLGTGVSIRKVAGIGIGIPGIVDAAAGTVVVTPNMSLSGVHIVRELTREFKTRVVIGNDANVGLLGEQWQGAARGARDVVGLFVGTGLGAGVISGGRLLTGSHGAAAEIGHMIVDPDGPRCSCGNRGCLEAFVGRWAIERDIREAIRKGKKVKFKKLKNKARDKIKSGLIKKALQRKDPIVTSVMRRSGEALGQACISLRHIFDPEIIILGGGVIEACGDFLTPIVRKKIVQDKFFVKVGSCAVRQSLLGDDAIILGGAALVMRYLQECR